MLLSCLSWFTLAPRRDSNSIFVHLIRYAYASRKHDPGATFNSTAPAESRQIPLQSSLDVVFVENRCGRNVSVQRTRWCTLRKQTKQNDPRCRCAIEGTQQPNCSKYLYTWTFRGAHPLSSSIVSRQSESSSLSEETQFLMIARPAGQHSFNFLHNVRIGLPKCFLPE